MLFMWHIEVIMGLINGTCMGPIVGIRNDVGYIGPG